MTEPVPLSPPVPRRGRSPDVVLAILVLIFAFLAASFAARNSDLWLHLATGRALVRGDYHLGTDPFAYTTHGLYWANPAWLSDLGLYLGFQLLGGTGLVVLKAAAVAVLAGLMLLAARNRDSAGGPFWVSGACVVLAVLAMTPRLLLQPVCLSLVLLALCLWLLRTGGRALYAVPVVVALWVNLDNWFLLGPVLVALFGLGQLLAPRGTPEDRTATRRLPLWLLPACLAACLVSPHHIFALTLPAELSPGVWRSEFATDPRFAGLFARSWRLEQLGPAGGFNLSAWAFLILLALGLLSFFVNRSAVRSWRFPVCLAFAVLAVWQVRLVPFFAVVAGPITALNFRERLAPEAQAVLGRLGLLLVTLALLLLTWPGWLQGVNRNDRPLAWAVVPDPSLRRAATTLAGWRKQGALPPEVRTFALHPDVAHYCVWFCPGEKVFLDSRLPLFVGVAGDYERLCRALSLGSDSSGAEAAAEDTDRILREHHIACAVLYDPDRQRLAAALTQFDGSPGPWELLQVDGQAVVIGRKEAVTSWNTLAAFDADRLALAADGDDALLSAPGEGSVQLAEPPAWWDLYLNRSSGSSWEAEAAAVYVRLFEDGAAQQLQQQRVLVLTRQIAGLIALPTPPADTVSASVAVASRLLLPDVFVPDLQERPPALPLLGVRAARRAVAAHPDDANAWLVLALATRYLDRATTESATAVRLAPLAEVRAIQTATALLQAVTLKPDLTVAHEKLALLYAERQYLDLALRHLKIQLRLTREAGRLPEESSAAFKERLAYLERAVEQMQTTVDTSENRFLVRSQALAADPLARAHLALELGLAGKALDDVLLKSHPDLYRNAGLRLLLELLLGTGRAQEARILLDRDEMRRNPNELGVSTLMETRLDGQRWGYRFSAYDWFDLCQAAAAGRYTHASGVLERLRRRLEHDDKEVRAEWEPRAVLRLTSELGLTAMTPPIGLRIRSTVEREEAAGMLVQSQFLPIERADLHALEAMLLLERGQPREAADQFRHAVTLYHQADETVPALPGLDLSRRYLERMQSLPR